jgi:hypothetical protein
MQDQPLPLPLPQAQQQPLYPQTAININEQGLIISIALAPGTQITQVIPEKSMNDIVAKWIESRREIRKQMDLIRHVQSTKIN